MTRVPFLIAAALVLAAAPTHAEDVDPVAVVKTVASDTGRVVVSIEGPDAGTLLPLCESDTGTEPNSTMLGTITGGCFLPLGPYCEAFIVTVNPDHTPPKVNANPNWMCIEDTINDLLDGPGTRLGLPLHIEA